MRCADGSAGVCQRTRSFLSIPVGTRRSAAGRVRVVKGGNNSLRPDPGGRDEQTLEARGTIGSVLTKLVSPGSASSRTGPNGGRMSRNPIERRAPPQAVWSFDSHTSFVASPGGQRQGRIGAVLIRCFGRDAPRHQHVPIPYTPNSDRAMAPSYRVRNGESFLLDSGHPIGCRSGPRLLLQVT